MAIMGVNPTLAADRNDFKTRSRDRRERGDSNSHNSVATNQATTQRSIGVGYDLLQLSGVWVYYRTRTPNE